MFLSQNMDIHTEQGHILKKHPIRSLTVECIPKIYHCQVQSIKYMCRGKNYTFAVNKISQYLHKMLL